MNKVLKFTANVEQMRELEALAYWRAGMAYFVEKNSQSEPYYQHEIDRLHKNILFSFDMLDKLAVPFWVQNSALAWGEEWRNVKRESMRAAMARKNIFM